MNDLAQNLKEYLDTREASIAADGDKYGTVGRELRRGETEMLADIRAIMDGQPLPRGAE